MSSPIRFARELRQMMTPQETILWEILRNRRFNCFKFRRQHPVVYSSKGWSKNFYVADFYCAAKKLVIELDGKHHQFSSQKEYDEIRDYILNEKGMSILRIQNDEFKNLERVLQKIDEALRSLPDFTASLPP